MKMKPAVRTQKEIDQMVAGVSGTWVRRRNAQNKLTAWSNELTQKDIEIQKATIRNLRASGSKECDLRPHYAEITKLELQLL